MGTRRHSRKPRGSTGATSLADALFAKVQQRVLGVLFGNPGRSFYANEVIGLARSGTGAVQRELARLEASGLVRVTRLGKQKHYQANPDSPIFNEVRALVLKTVALTDVLRLALAPVSRSIRRPSSTGRSQRARIPPPATSISWSSATASLTPIFSPRSKRLRPSSDERSRRRSIHRRNSPNA